MSSVVLLSLVYFCWAETPVNKVCHVVSSMARSTANLLVTLEGTSDIFRKKRVDNIAKYLDNWGESLKIKIER